MIIPPRGKKSKSNQIGACQVTVLLSIWENFNHAIANLIPGKLAICWLKWVGSEVGWVISCFMIKVNDIFRLEWHKPAEGMPIGWQNGVQFSDLRERKKERQTGKQKGFQRGTRDKKIDRKKEDSKEEGRHVLERRNYIFLSNHYTRH